MWRTFLALKRKKELKIPFPAVVAAIFAAFIAYKGFCIADRSEELQKWYEENHEAIYSKKTSACTRRTALRSVTG